MGALEEELNVGQAETLKTITESMDKIKQVADSIEKAPAFPLPEDPGPLDVPEQAQMPEEIRLEEFETMSINASIWREDSAKKSIMLANGEMERVKEMREKLLQQCKIKYGIPDNYNYSIDPKAKLIRLKKK